MGGRLSGIWSRARCGALGPILCGVLAVLLVILANGRPTVFPDTDDYLAHGRNFAFEAAWATHVLDRPAPPRDEDEIETAQQLVQDQHMSHPELKARSPYYGAGLYLTQRIGTLWLLTLPPAAIGCALIWRLWRILAPDAPQWSAYAVQAATAVGSTLPFFASFAMPDVFAGYAALAVAILMAAWGKTGWLERAALAVLIAFATAIHGSHGLLILGLTVTGAGALWWFKASWKRIAKPAALILIGFASALAANAVYWKAVEWKTGDYPGRPPFLSVRLLADGPGRDYLRFACAHGEDYGLCRYRNLPLDDSDEIMWSDDPGKGVFNNSDYNLRLRMEREEIRFALGTLKYDPLGVTGAALKNWGAQLLGVFVDDPLRDPHYYLTNTYWKDTNLPWLIERMGWCGADRHGCRSRLNREGSMVLHGALFLLALGLVGWRLSQPDLRARLPRREFGDDAGRSLLILALILVAVLINALICGALSGPFPRYQARLVWIVSAAGFAGLAAFAPARLTVPAGIADHPLGRRLIGLLGGSFFRYALVGTAGFLIDRLMLSAAMGLLGLNYFTGRLVSFSIAVMATWLLNRAFTFEGARSHPPLRQALVYVAVQVAGGVLNVGVYTLAIALAPVLKLHLLIPLAFGSAAGLCVTYLGARSLAFRRGA